MRAALEQQRLDVARAELPERVGDARALVVAAHANDLDARGLERLRGGPRGGARADEDHGYLARRLDELARQREARLRVEDHALRLAPHTLHTGGEQRVVGEDGPDAGGDRVGLGSPAVRACAARV